MLRNREKLTYENIKRNFQLYLLNSCELSSPYKDIWNVLNTNLSEINIKENNIEDAYFHYQSIINQKIYFRIHYTNKFILYSFSLEDLIIKFSDSHYISYKDRQSILKYYINYIIKTDVSDFFIRSM